MATFEGEVKEADGTVSALTTLETSPLPDVTWTSVDTVEEPVTVTGGGGDGPMCRTKSTPVQWVQHREHHKITTYAVVKESSSSWGWGVALTVVGVIAVGVVIAATGGLAAIPVLGAAGTAAAGTTAATAATITVAGGITLGAGFCAVGVGQTIVWGVATPGVKKGGVIPPVKEMDINLGSPVATLGTPSYGPVHPCTH